MKPKLEFKVSYSSIKNIHNQCPISIKQNVIMYNIEAEVKFNAAAILREEVKHKNK